MSRTRTLVISAVAAVGLAAALVAGAAATGQLQTTTPHPVAGVGCCSE